MILDHLFASQKTLQAEIQSMTQTLTNGVLGPKVWSMVKTVNCIFWSGGMTESLISGKLAADVSGTIILKPESISGISITNKNRICLRNSNNVVLGYYALIKSDNIAYQEKVLMLPVKEFV